MGSLGREFLKQGKHISTYLCLGVMALFIIIEFIMSYGRYNQLMQNYHVQLTYANAHHLHLRLGSGAIQAMKGVMSPLAPPSTITWSMAILSTVGPIVSCIIGAIVVGNDYRFGTQRLSLTVGPNRSRVWLSKVFTVLMFNVVMIVLMCIIGIVTVHLIDSIHNVHTNGAPNTGSFIMQFFSSVLGLFLWGVVGFATTIMTRSTVIGVLAGILWPIMESAVLDLLPIRTALPLFNQKSLLADVYSKIGQNGPVAFTMGTPAAGTAHALIVTCMYLIALLIVALYVYRRQAIQ